MPPRLLMSDLILTLFLFSTSHSTGFQIVLSLGIQVVHDGGYMTSGVPNVAITNY